MAGVIPKSQKKAMRRIMKDIKGAREMESLGIYVHYDPEKVFEACAMIIGPEKTPYENGFFLFHIKFPLNYPFKSPTVKFMTGDGKTRFHPNLYVNGKVCLSILGTWTGPSWTSSQNISSVLTTIQSLLDEAPVRNEPGFEKEKGEKVFSYNRVIQHQVYAVTVLYQLEKCPKKFKPLYPHMKKHFIDNFNWYLCLLNSLSDKDGNVEKSKIFNVVVKYDYSGILNGLTELYNEFSCGEDGMIVTEDMLKFVTTEETAPEAF